ncbi:MAG: hypothetical protein AB8F34_08795 [Akkermansiaceae bacterium]
MPRRNRNAGDEGTSLDSLMDALTNVVAVLILVLVLVRVDVTQKVADFLDNLKPATPEELAQNQQVLQKSENKKVELIKLLENEAPDPAEIEKAKTDLAILEKDAKTRDDLLVELEELKKLEKKAREQRDAEQEKTEAMQKRIAELESQLDQTPMPEAPPATVVNIPNSRDIPRNAQKYYAYVHEDRVHFIDPFTPEEQFVDVAKKNRREWMLKRVKRKGADKYIYDQRKIVQYFKEKPLLNKRGQKIVVPGHPTGHSLYIDIKPDLAKGGTHLDQLGENRSLFADIMRKVSSNRRSIIMFRVHPNAFHTYLEARKVADRYKVPAGWEVTSRGFHRFHVHDVSVNRLKEPPPPKKPDGPKPPKIDPKLD